LQRFPSQSRLTRSPAHNSSDSTLPENYTSWSSLQIDQMKKQRTSADTSAVSKQPNLSYYSVDTSNLAVGGTSLIPAQRRRAQNRASQRAFRERKERHVKNLEQQLEDLHQQYEELLRAYDEQKEEIFNLRTEMQELHSEPETLQVPGQNSPLEYGTRIRTQSLQSENKTLQFQQTGLLMPQSQSLTPSSTFEQRISSSRASVSEEQTLFGSLRPLTPAENFETATIFRPSDAFFASREGSRCYSVDEYQEAQQNQQQEDFGSPGFSKAFAINPSADIFEGWR